MYSTAWVIRRPRLCKSAVTLRRLQCGLGYPSYEVNVTLYAVVLQPSIHPRLCKWDIRLTGLMSVLMQSSWYQAIQITYQYTPTAMQIASTFTTCTV